MGDMGIAMDIMEFIQATYASAIPGVAQFIANQISMTDIGFDLQNQDTCPESPKAEAADGFFDFRDLLLPPEEAIEYGGSGDDPYVAWELIDAFYLLTTDIDPATGEPIINTFIRNATESQSGTKGSLLFEDVFDINWNISESIALRNIISWNMSESIALRDITKSQYIGLTVANFSLLNSDTF